MIVGTVIGAGTAIGSGGLLQVAANAAKVQLPQVVKDFAPLAGAAAVAGLAMLSRSSRSLVMPTLIGGAIWTVLQRVLAAKTNGAGAYPRLRGAGNVARVLSGGAAGAGNVARVLNATATVR